MTELLNINANAKTVKGIKHGFSTAVMYLAPYKVSGYQVCPFADIAGCWQTCLNTAGHGGIPQRGYKEFNGITLPDNNVQTARIRRTKLWVEQKDLFWRTLVGEITRFLQSAKRKKLTPIVRLNGTSDIMWENQKVTGDNIYAGQTIFEIFPHVQFYDYTKIAKRLRHQATDPKWPKNYYLCLSYSEADPKYAKQCWKMHDEYNASLVMVLRDKVTKERYLENYNSDDYTAIDGDGHDMRFLDTPGALIMLKAKGSAKRETNGFVLD